jgi:hypothetical protein
VATCTVSAVGSPLSTACGLTTGSGGAAFTGAALTIRGCGFGGSGGGGGGGGGGAISIASGCTFGCNGRVVAGRCSATIAPTCASAVRPTSAASPALLRVPTVRSWRTAALTGCGSATTGRATGWTVRRTAALRGEYLMLSKLSVVMTRPLSCAYQDRCRKRA